MYTTFCGFEIELFIIICFQLLVYKYLRQTTDEAVAMLHALSNRHHEVLTGCCVVLRNQNARFTSVDVNNETVEFSSSTNDPKLTVHSWNSSTRVHFAELSDKEIAAYVLTGEPMYESQMIQTVFALYK